VLRVEQHGAAGLDEQADGLGDHRAVLVLVHLQHVPRVQVPALAHHGDHRGLAVQQRPQAVVLFGPSAAAARHAERRHLRRPQTPLADLLEEGRVLRIAQRVAALDVVHARRVQGLGDLQLVVQGQADRLALRAVPQRRVVRLDSRCAGVHDSLPSCGPPARRAHGTHEKKP